MSKRIIYTLLIPAVVIILSLVVIVTFVVKHDYIHASMHFIMLLSYLYVVYLFHIEDGRD